MTQLPDGWVTATINELIAGDGLFVDGDWVETKDQDPTGEVRLTQLADVGEGWWRDRSDRYMTAAVADRLGCTFLQVNDVLVARMPDPLGRSSLFPGDPRQCVTVVDVAIVRPGLASVSPAWLMWAINAPTTRIALEAQQAGTTRKRISRKNLGEIELPIPPCAEQDRIVTAIEEAFSKLDAGEAGLRTVRQLLKRMREAVLAAAVAGRLIPQDPADIAVRADALHDALQDLPALPSLWSWASIESAASGGRHALAIGPFGSNLKVDDYRALGVPLVFVRNIRQENFASPQKFVSNEKAAELAAHVVRPGDVLVTKMGDPPGDAAVYRHAEPAIITADCIKVTPGETLLADFLAMAIRTGETRRRLRELTSGVAQQKITLAGFRRLPVPLPPIAEQRRIVSEVERQLSFIQACERAVDAGLARSAALRRAVLRAASDGRLVPQDPSEEPASALLARIIAERAASRGSSGGRRRKKVEAS